MKILITITFFLVIAVDSSAQNSLSNTTWKGVMLIPGATDVRLNFKKDSLFLTTEAGQEIGALIYSQHGDTLTIRKVAGSSPCPEETQGVYHIEWLEKDKKFRLHGISDECEGRIGVYTTNPFTRIQL
jgi:hypothetical protein